MTTELNELNANTSLQAPLESKPEPMPMEVETEAIETPQAEPAKESLPAPTAPKETGVKNPVKKPDATEQTELKWKDLFKNNPLQVPQIVVQGCGANDFSMTEEEREYRICSVVNRSWYAAHHGESKEQVRSSWPELRSRLAEELKVRDDEREIYMALGLRYDEKHIQKIAAEAYKRSYQAGLDNEQAADLSELRNQLPLEYHESLDVLAANAYDDGNLEYSKYSAIADTLATGFDSIAAMEEDYFPAYNVLSNAPDLWAAVNRLSSMPEEKRKLVYYLAIKKNRAGRKRMYAEEGTLSRMHRAWKRGVSNMGLNILQLGGQYASTLMDDIGDVVGIDSLRHSSRDLDKFMRICREVRLATQNEVIPLERVDSSLAETLLLTAAEAAPAAIVSCTGGTGFLTLATSSMGASVGDARLRSSDSNQKKQLGAGILSGAVQASIFMGMNRMGGRMFERTVNTFMKQKGLSAGAFSWAALNASARIGVDASALFLAGKAAGAADLLLQENASRMDNVDSGIDWEQYVAGLTDEDVNLREAAAMLPYLLIGSGRAALRDFRASERLIGDGDRLAAWGIPEQKIREIMNERDIDRRNTLLREALCMNKVWSGPGFILDHIRAMRLLNTKYFNGFERPDVVVDFLKLPAESAAVKRPETGARSLEEMINTPNHARERSGYLAVSDRQRYKEAMTLWDEWWVRSNIASYSSRVQLGEWVAKHPDHSARYERTTRYLQDYQDRANGIPGRMRNTAIYAPNAENERRALLRDRVSEIQDLSYQYLMNVNPLDSILFKDYAVSKVRADAEKTRMEFLGAVGRAVIRAGQGQPHQENMKEFSEYFQNQYLRKKYRKRGAYLTWLKELPPDYLSKMHEHALRPDAPEYAAYPELQEAYRIYLGIRTNTELLIELIPMMEDFQTSLSRGMTPSQAYAHIIERELGYNPEQLRSYPTDELAYPANKTPMEEYSLKNAELCEKYMRLSGASLEQSVGDDGQTYWRLKRPDGTFSRWHENPSYAMNDVAANAALTFMPMGQGIHLHWLRAARADKVNLNDTPQAEDMQFSGYDQICSYAMRDLTRYWLESAPYFQPGFIPERTRHRFLRREDYGTGLEPMYHTYTDDAAALTFDLHTMATPYGMASARFFTYWKRALDAGILPPEQAESFLRSIGSDWLEHTDKLEPVADAMERHAALAQDMGKFSTCYFLLKAPELPIPSTVKEWLGYAAFCPPATIAEEMPEIVPLGSGHVGIVRWSNRRIATQLQELLPQVEQLRERFGSTTVDVPAISEHLTRAMGYDVAQNQEQSWCHYLCDESALHAASPAYWELLRSPEKGWQLMPATEQAMLSEYVSPFLEKNPPPGQQAGQNAVESALHNLDEMLKQVDNMHAYSYNGSIVNQLSVMGQPAHAEQMSDAVEEPLYTPLPFYYPQGIQQRVPVLVADAEQMAVFESPEARHALLFLDTLRRYPSSMPYAVDSTIWWNNVRYGGKKGKAPSGLEDYTPLRPLGRIVKLLGDVHEMCLTKNTEFMSFCGVPIPNLTPEELRHPALTSMTVYRRLGGAETLPYTTQLSRLMPGDPTSTDVRERHPYVVEVRDGAYFSGNKLVRDASDPLLTLQALPSYTRTQYRNIKDESSTQGFEDFFNSALDALLAIEKRGDDFMVDRRSGALSLQELLMRLYEDTNFSAGIIGNKSIQELTPPALRALRLAADLISCMVAPRQPAHPLAKRAFERLRSTLRHMRRDTSYRESVEHMLRKANQELKDKVNNMIKL